MRPHLRLHHVGRTLAVLVACAVALVAAPAPASAQSSPATVRPTADLWAPAGAPERAARGGRDLQVGGGPRGRAFIRFDLRSVTTVPARAILRVYVRSSPRGRRLAVLRVRRGGSWSERRGVPKPGRLVRRSTRLRPRRWLALDVTAAVRP